MSFHPLLSGAAAVTGIGVGGSSALMPLRAVCTTTGGTGGERAITGDWGGGGDGGGDSGVGGLARAVGGNSRGATRGGGGDAGGGGRARVACGVACTGPRCGLAWRTSCWT